MAAIAATTPFVDSTAVALVVPGTEANWPTLPPPPAAAAVAIGPPPLLLGESELATEPVLLLQLAVEERRSVTE